MRNRSPSTFSGSAHTTAHNDLIRSPRKSDSGGGHRRSVYVCKTTGKVKVRTVVTIDKELFDKVISLAPLVYGIQRGALERAIEEGLALWLQTRANGTAVHVNPRAPLRERYNAVIECIELEFGHVPITIHQVFFEKCISNTFNVKDPRTIYGWLHRFYQAGLIKPLTISVTKQSDWRRNKAIEIVARKL